jgi:prephenate dehydrogenase
MKKQHVFIIGAGVVGGSLARKLAEYESYQVSVWSKDEEDRVFLKDRQVKDRRIKSLIIEDDFIHGLKTIAAEPDAIVVLATPPSFFPELIQTIRDHAPNSIITDTASVKKPVVAMIEQLKLREGFSQRFIPAHPVAGNAGSGAKDSNPDMFMNAKNMIVRPQKWVDDQWQTAARRVEDMWLAVGCATNCGISPDIHDRIYGAVSHVPHLMAFGLRDMEPETFNPESLERKAFYQFVRLTDSPRASFWLDVFHDNKEMIQEVLGYYRDELQTVRGMVNRREWSALSNYVNEAQKPLQNSKWASGPKIPIPYDSSTRQTLFPIMAGAAFSKALGKAQTSMGEANKHYDLFEYANSGLKSILNPLAVYRAPETQTCKEHEIRLDLLLKRYHTQLDKTWNDMLKLPESAAAAAGQKAR